MKEDPRLAAYIKSCNDEAEESYRKKRKEEEERLEIEQYSSLVEELKRMDLELEALVKPEIKHPLGDEYYKSPWLKKSLERDRLSYRIYKIEQLKKR